MADETVPPTGDAPVPADVTPTDAAAAERITGVLSPDADAENPVAALDLSDERPGAGSSLTLLPAPNPDDQDRGPIQPREPDQVAMDLPDPPAASPPTNRVNNKPLLPWWVWLVLVLMALGGIAGGLAYLRSMWKSEAREETLATMTQEAKVAGFSQMHNEHADSLRRTEKAAEARGRDEEAAKHPSSWAIMAGSPYLWPGITLLVWLLFTGICLVRSDYYGVRTLTLLLLVALAVYGVCSLPWLAIFDRITPVAERWWLPAIAIVAWLYTVYFVYKGSRTESPIRHVFLRLIVSLVFWGPVWAWWWLNSVSTREAVRDAFRIFSGN